MQEAKAYIDFAEIVKSPYVRVMVSSVPQPTGKEDLAQTRELYAQLCAYAEGKEVKVLIETNGALANSQALAQMMRTIQDVYKRQELGDDYFSSLRFLFAL